jgi:hypothetical protein
MGWSGRRKTNVFSYTEGRFEVIIRDTNRLGLLYDPFSEALDKAVLYSLLSSLVLV